MSLVSVENCGVQPAYSGSQPVTLKAFFDESGKKDQPVSCVGGCISSSEGWKKLEECWQIVLREYGIDWHHQVDWSHCEKQFLKWKSDEESKKAYQGNLLRIMHHYVFRYVGAAIKLDDFNRLTNEQRSVAEDPYLPCLQVALHAAACEAKGLPDDVKVEVVIAKNTKLGGKAKDLYQKARAYLPKEDRIRLLPEVSITEMPKSFNGHEESRLPIPLQAADLVAYELNQYVQGKHRFPMKELMNEEDHYYWRIFDWNTLNYFCQEWTPVE
jgi:hypothetical protein